MPAAKLKPEHEQFCQLIAAGNSACRAYQQIYGLTNRDHCDQSASRLMKLPKIKSRIQLMRSRFSAALAVSQADALSSQVVQETVKDVLTLAEKRAFLASVVRTPVGNVDEYSPLTQEVTHATDKDGNLKKTVKIAGKLKALELDARLAGELESQDTARVTLNLAFFSGGVK